MAYPWCEFFWLFRPLMANGCLGSIPAVRQSPLSVRLGSDRTEQPAPVTIRLPASAFHRVFP